MDQQESAMLRNSSMDATIVVTAEQHIIVRVDHFGTAVRLDVNNFVEYAKITGPSSRKRVLEKTHFSDSTLRSMRESSKAVDREQYHVLKRLVEHSDRTTTGGHSIVDVVSVKRPKRSIAVNMDWMNDD